MQEKLADQISEKDILQKLIDKRRENLNELNTKRGSDFEWLNDESRHFLNAGYLLDHETAEDRIWEIAQTAEKILGNTGFAIFNSTFREIQYPPLN